MKERKFNWLLAKDLRENVYIYVRQDDENRDRFVEESGNAHHVLDLDFTHAVGVLPQEVDFVRLREKMRNSEDEHARMQEQLRDMLSQLDAKGIADHQAVIDERAYWRRLRGEVFMKILDRGGEFTKHDELKWAWEMTDKIINNLYMQDKEYFSNKEQ